MVLLQAKTCLLLGKRSTPKGQEGKLICPIISCMHTIKLCPGRQPTSKLRLLLTSMLMDGGFVSGTGCVPTPRTTRGPEVPPPPALVSSIFCAKLLGTLAGVVHVAVILQDCLSHPTAFVLVNPSASFHQIR